MNWFPAGGEPGMKNIWCSWAGGFGFTEPAAIATHFRHLENLILDSPCPGLGNGIPYSIQFPQSMFTSALPSQTLSWLRNPCFVCWLTADQLTACLSLEDHCLLRNGNLFLPHSWLFFIFLSTRSRPVSTFRLEHYVKKWHFFFHFLHISFIINV